MSKLEMFPIKDVKKVAYQRTATGFTTEGRTRAGNSSSGTKELCQSEFGVRKETMDRDTPIPLGSVRILATAYLRSMTGRSAIDEKGPIRDSAPYVASRETREKAIGELEKRGFKVEGAGVTVSISGPVGLFEHTFDVKIRRDEQPDRTGTTSTFVFRSSRPVMAIKGLEDVIEGVVLTGQAVYF